MSFKCRSGLKEIQCNLLKFNLLDDTIIEHMTLTGGERMASSTRSLKRRLGSYDMSFFEGASTVCVIFSEDYIFI